MFHIKYDVLTSKTQTCYTFLNMSIYSLHFKTKIVTCINFYKTYFNQFDESAKLSPIMENNDEKYIW